MGYPVGQGMQFVTSDHFSHREDDAGLDGVLQSPSRGKVHITAPCHPLPKDSSLLAWGAREPEKA